MKKYFITSDVHSFFSIMFNSLINKGFNINNKEHFLIICGDLFDRGPESKQMLDFVQTLGDRFIYIRGNHESLLKKCVFDFFSGYSIENYHYSNGTIKTISQLCDIEEKEFYKIRFSDSFRSAVKEKMQPILNWIDNKSMDYFCVEDYIFVHGWIPIKGDRLLYTGSWTNPKPTPFEWWGNNQEIWEEARWINGMKAWKEGCRLEGKTIICGHWHCSWGHSHLRQNRKEFPPKNRKDWEKSFEPFIDEGIIAIDACTAYSGLCNVIVLETEKE